MKENDTLGQVNSMINSSRKGTIQYLVEKWILACIIGLKKKRGIIMGVQLQNKLVTNCNFQSTSIWKNIWNSKWSIKGK